MTTFENVNPRLYGRSDDRIVTNDDRDEDVIDEFDSREIFDLIKNINDPEHPLTLEQLNVVDIENISVDNSANKIEVKFTPTIPHCSMASLIGLAIRVQLLRCLPHRFKVSVRITPGSHNSEDALNKQLGDKERVAAALENINLIQTINQCLRTTVPAA